MASNRHASNCKARRRVFAAAQIAVSFAATLAVPDAAHAQGGPQTQVQSAPRAAALRDIRPGQSIHSRLNPVSSETSEDYRLHLEANDSVEILMDSPSLEGRRPATPADGESNDPTGFDTYLELRRLGVANPIATNDDRGDGTLNSRLIFTATTSGDYIIRARPLGGSLPEGRDPTYTLAVRALPRAPAPAPFQGSRVEGDLSEESPVIDVGQQPNYYAAYTIEGSASERIQLNMRANVPEPVLELIGPNGNAVAIDVGDDQGSARILAILPESGRYVARAQVARGAPAHYSLEMARAMPVPLAAPAPIALGAPVDDALRISSDATPRGTGPARSSFFYKLYALPVQFGQPVTITLEATEFDPVLEAGTLSVLGFQIVISDDDSGPGNGARIVMHPMETGTAYLRARAPGLDLGEFRLRTVAGVLPPEQ